MKKLLIIVAVLINLISLSAIDGFATGSGTVSDPYRIASVTELNLVRNFLGSVNSSKNFTLTANLDLADQGVNGWLPIGDATNRFNGKLDGNGFKISGLLIDRSTTDLVGLFGCLDSSAVLQNLGVVFGGGGIITGKIICGGLVGVNYGSIDGCYAPAVFLGTAEIVGGLVGLNYGDISNSFTLGTITGAGSSQIIGGLVGVNNGAISFSNTFGTVTGSVKNVGGFVGSNKAGTISFSYATGAIHGLAAVGGFAGDNFGNINNSYATGAVNAADSLGGFIGVNYGTINNSYATGATNGSGSYVGGFVGISRSPITSCYATGVSNGTGSYVGGFAGLNDSLLNNSYATGATTATGSYAGGLVGINESIVTDCYSVGATVGASNVGGLVGKNNNTVNNSFWNKETSGQLTSDGSDNSFGKTTTEMKLQSTYSGWDFTNVWIIDLAINTGYPSFKVISSALTENILIQKELLSNYPNPFNPSTVINYNLQISDIVNLAVYNAKGELVKTLAKEMQTAGKHSIVFDGAGLNSGVYFYKLETNGKCLINKMILIK